MNFIEKSCSRVAMVAVVVLLCDANASAQTTLKSICRIKGQDETIVHGYGLVFGLKGTGDGKDSIPMMRALARSMQLMGIPVGVPGDDPSKVIGNAKNVALVQITVVIPATGAQQGEKLDCYVSAPSAKSLQGGRLMSTPLISKDVRDQRVVAIAFGQVELDDPKNAPAAGKIHRGCILEVDYTKDQFIQDDRIILVLHPDQADISQTVGIAELINTQLLAHEKKKAVALDASRIEVPISAAYLSAGKNAEKADPIGFISQVLELPMHDPQVKPRIVINQRTESIVVSGDVRIGAAIVRQKNVTVQTDEGGKSFFLIDPNGTSLSSKDRNDRTGTRLTHLLEALSAAKVSDRDMIEIIKGLEKNGKLSGELILY